MHTDTIYIVGAGGHAKVVVDSLLLSGVSGDRIRLTDGNEKLAGTQVLDWTVTVPAVRDDMRDSCFHVAIGHAGIRARLHAQLLALGGRPVTIVHPRATVSSYATLGQGVFVAAHAVVAPSARIGDGAIVNHSAVVDHDCEVGQFSHIAPSATLAGAVRIGEGVLVGAGAKLLPSVQVGDQAVIGAGAVVLENVPAAHTYIGVPAVSKRKEKSE
jgi:sugar O-acyltransferase (sialic acid O-acetyltransferase NeuD family)